MRSPPIALIAAAMLGLAACTPSVPAPPDNAASGPGAVAPPAGPAATPAAPPSGPAAVINLGPRPAVFAGADPTGYSQWLAGQALTDEQQTAGAPCPAATVTSVGVSDASPPFLRPPPGLQFINTSGVEHLLVQGCGRTDRLNILVLRQSDGVWVPARLLDGDSITGPQLEHDGLPIAVGAMAAVSGCGQPKLVTTRLAQPPNGPHTPWQEIWVGMACGKEVDVLMTFTPDATGPGTSINASIPRG